MKNEPFFFEGSPDQACLLLHGLGGGAYELYLLGEFLHGLGYTVQGLLYPGHDQPGPKMPRSTWDQWYKHSEASYQQLALKYSKIYVIGHSTGCPLALHLAAHYPVAKLVLMSPYLRLRHQWYYLLPLEAYLFSLGYIIDDVPSFNLPIKDSKMRQAADQVAFLQTFNITAVRSANALIDLVKTELSKIHTPTLILQSREDSVVDPAGAEYYYQNIGASIKKIHWLKTSDHTIALDLEREEVFSQIKAWL